jgi:hypothetical protein
MLSGVKSAAMSLGRRSGCTAGGKRFVQYQLWLA